MEEITMMHLIGDCAKRFSQFFWSPEIWLPSGYTWEQLESDDQIAYPKFYDLGYAFVFSVLVYYLRQAFESSVFIPLGMAFGLKSAPTKKFGVSNEALGKLEKSYSRCKGKLNEVDVGKISNELGWSKERVAKYLHVKKKAKPSSLKKFSESAWRFTYYTFAFLFGVWVLQDKEWVWDIDKCWATFPRQSITNDVWWYYMISLGFYGSLMISVLNDTRRKDFVEMVIHHIITIALVSLSWTCNMVRAGSLVIVIHDVADIFLESAKMATYVHQKRLSNWLIHIFAGVWIITRLAIFPFWILRSTLFGALKFVPTVYPVYYIFNTMISTLMVLHLIWSYYIGKILINIWRGEGTRDSRSDDEDSGDECINLSPEKKKTT